MLKEVYLARCNIGIDGAEAIAAAIRVNATLRTLDLTRNVPHSKMLTARCAAFVALSYALARYGVRHIYWVWPRS